MQQVPDRDVEAATETERRRVGLEDRMDAARARYLDALYPESDDDDGYAPVLAMTGPRYGWCSECDHPLESAGEQERGVHVRHEDDAGMPPGFWGDEL